MAETFSPNHKRVKFGGSEDEHDDSTGGSAVASSHTHPDSAHEPILLNANSRIHLCFHDHLLLAPFHTFPTFTHQLFENQQIRVSGREEKNLKIEVHVDCRTLRHAVNITGVDASSETFDAVVQAMRKGVPEDTTFHNDHHFHFLSMRFESEDEQELLTPPGSLLHSFVLKEGDDDREEYECYHCSSDSFSGAKLLKRAEKVAMWFIETADGVEFLNNPQWEVLWLYQRGTPVIQPQFSFAKGDVTADTRATNLVAHNAGESVYSLVGYMTLYTFHSPQFGSRMRVCQALIMPYKRSQGLGRELFLDVYQLALKRATVREVTVEDPCEGFQRLRDSVEYEWALIQSAQKPESWANTDDETLGEKWKIIRNQVMFVKEAYEYLELIQSLKNRIVKDEAAAAPSATANATADEEELVDEGNISSAAENTDAGDAVAADMTAEDIEQLAPIEKLEFLHSRVEKHDAFVAFRLKVKRNLLKEDKDLKYLDKKAMQKELAARFSQRMTRYVHVLRSMYHQHRLDSDLLDSDALATLL